MHARTTLTRSHVTRGPPGSDTYAPRRPATREKRVEGHVSRSYPSRSLEPPKSNGQKKLPKLTFTRAGREKKNSPEVVVLRPDHAPRRRRCRRLPLRLRLRPRRRLRLRGGGRRHRGVLGDRPERRLPRRPRRPPPPLLRGRRHRRRLLLRRLIHRRRRQPPAAPHEGEQLHPRA